LNITTRYIRAIKAIKHAKGCASVRYGGPCTCGRDTRIARGLQRAIGEASRSPQLYVEFPESHPYAKRFSPLGREAAGLLAFKAHAR
jgi:hypothetical protein